MIGSYYPQQHIERSISEYEQVEHATEESASKDTKKSMDISPDKPSDESTEITPAKPSDDHSRQLAERSVAHANTLSDGDIDPDKLKKENEIESLDRSNNEPGIEQKPLPGNNGEDNDHYYSHGM